MLRKEPPYRSLRLFRFSFASCKDPYTHSKCDQYTQINDVFCNDADRTDGGSDTQYHQDVKYVGTDGVTQCHIDFIFLAATMEVTSSGRDVPMETMVSPISVCVIPRSLAILDAASTVRSPPKAIAAAPPTMKTMLSGTEISLISSSEPPSISTFFLLYLPLRQF